MNINTDLFKEDGENEELKQNQALNNENHTIFNEQKTKNTKEFEDALQELKLTEEELYEKLIELIDNETIVLDYKVFNKINFAVETPMPYHFEVYFQTLEDFANLNVSTFELKLNVTNVALVLTKYKQHTFTLPKTKEEMLEKIKWIEEHIPTSIFYHISIKASFVRKLLFVLGHERIYTLLGKHLG